MLYEKPKLSENPNKWYMLYPDESFTVVWEIIISLVLIVSVVLTPY